MQTSGENADSDTVSGRHIEKRTPTAEFEIHGIDDDFFIESHFGFQIVSFVALK